MDVPFFSSGAMSRVHYALVRDVENASSSSVADHHLLAKVESIRHILARPTLSPKECRESLVLLLYCVMSSTSGVITSDHLDFALPHAVNLAETGVTVQHKRIGYLFCIEIMPPNHELQLMLVNTVRKDLESSVTARVCLALDTIIASSTEDIIPAVESRLHDLLSHNSPHVRRRALLAFRRLSHHNRELLQIISKKVQKRLKDIDKSVAGAALSVCIDIFEAYPMETEFQKIVNSVLKSSWPTGSEKSKQLFLAKVLCALCTVKLSPEYFQLIMDIIHYTSGHAVHFLLNSAFTLLSTSSTEELLKLRTSTGRSPVSDIRNLLTSRDPNHQYVFLSCLECLDPQLWAGTRPDIPAALGAWEVECVMKLLDSQDPLIRKKTLRVLHRVDPNIADAYFQQALKVVPPMMTIQDKNSYAARLLEIAEIQSADDGELYARYLKDTLGAIEEEISGPGHVLEYAVEMALLHIRNANEAFCIGCTVTLVVSVTEDAAPGPTLAVIASAIATEYGDRLSIAPNNIVQGLARRLSSYPPSVQDACLLAMIRTAAKCNEIPEDVTVSVNALSQVSRRHIRQRCEQFIRLSRDKKALSGIVSRARSRSLPDFLEALILYESHSAQSPVATSSSPPRSPKQTSPKLGTNKLRYAAYEPPRPAPRLKRPPSSQRSVSSSRSSDHGRGNSRLSVMSDGRPSLDELSKTVTAGDLALVAGEYMEMVPLSPRSTQPLTQIPQEVEDLTSRVDLIAFDSPFISDPVAPGTSSTSDLSFETVWSDLESFHTRGWCEASIEGVVRRLQGLHYSLKVIAADLPPFEGDLKVLVYSASEGSHAALALREGEDESCLWRLRCDSNQLRTLIKQRLADA